MPFAADGGAGKLQMAGAAEDEVGCREGGLGLVAETG